MPTTQYFADFSLALINRTGAYYVCRDIVQRLPQFFRGIRYWRLFFRKEPAPLVRQLLGRAMLLELSHLRVTKNIPRSNGAGYRDVPTLFFDPLYVLRTRLRTNDVVLCHDIGPVSHPKLFAAKTPRLFREAYQRIVAGKPGMVFVSEASRSAF